MLRLLAAVSWSDGSLDEREAAALGRLIDASDLDDDERERARGWLSEQVEVDEEALDSLTENQRLASYQAAVRMALSDDDVVDEERSFLDRLRELLSIDAETATEIEASMPKHD